MISGIRRENGETLATKTFPFVVKCARWMLWKHRLMRRWTVVRRTGRWAKNPSQGASGSGSNDLGSFGFHSKNFFGW